MKKLIILSFFCFAVTAFSQSVLTLTSGSSIGLFNNTDLCANIYNGVQLIYGNGTLCSNLIGIEIDPQSNNLPVSFNMSQNYPNPFNPETTVKYQLPVSEYVVINIYDILGKETEIFNGRQSAGYYQLNINASDMSSGVYFLKLSAGDFSKVIKLSVIK